MNKVIVLILTAVLLSGCGQFQRHDDSITAFVPPPLYRQGPAQTTTLREYVPDDAPPPAPPARLQLASNDPMPPAVMVTPLSPPGVAPPASPAPVIVPAASGAPAQLTPIGVKGAQASRAPGEAGAVPTIQATAVASPAAAPAPPRIEPEASPTASAPTQQEEEKEPPPPPLPTWKWKAGDDLVKVFVEWTKTAGRTPRVLTPAHWRLLTDDQLTATYEDALEELLEGSSHDSPVPKAEIAPNGLVTLRSFIK